MDILGFSCISLQLLMQQSSSRHSLASDIGKRSAATNVTKGLNKKDTALHTMGMWLHDDEGEVDDCLVLTMMAGKKKCTHSDE